MHGEPNESGVDADTLRLAYVAAARAQTAQQRATWLRDRARDLDLVAEQHRGDARELAVAAGTELDEDDLNPCPF